MALNNDKVIVYQLIIKYELSIKYKYQECENLCQNNSANFIQIIENQICKQLYFQLQKEIYISLYIPYIWIRKTLNLNQPQKIMETYNDLLEQFHQVEVSVMEPDTHVKYKDLLNQIKLSKQKKACLKKEKSLENSRLKQFNVSAIKENLLDRSFKSVKENFVNGQNNQKLCIFTLETESLEQEMKQLKQSINNLKIEKNLLEQQLQILNDKQTETYRTNIESSQMKKQIQLQISSLKMQSYQFQVKNQQKLQSLKEKLNNLKQQNMLNSTRYNLVQQSMNKNQYKSFLDSIVGFGKHIEKSNQFKKKIYTKQKIQSILRTFYIVSKLSTLNYGNIIESLSKNKDIKSNRAISLEQLKDKMMYTDQNGEEISIEKLIQNINMSLLTQEEMRFLSKFKIVDYYQKLQINFDVNLVSKIKNHFVLLTSWFTRIQHRNIQLTQQLRHLQKTEQALNKKIQSIQQKAQNSQMSYIQERQQHLDLLSSKLDQNSKILFQFNIRSYELIKKFTSLNKLFDKIVKKTERKTFRKMFISDQSDEQFLKQFIQMLYRSPQHIIIEWNSALKKVRSSLRKSTSKIITNDQNNDGNNYLTYIMKNDLLRVYADPQMYNSRLSDIQNLSNTCNKVFEFQDKVLAQITKILRTLLVFSKKGIDQFLTLFEKITSNNSRKKREKIQVFQGIFPKQDQMSKFLIKDQIKQKYCVQTPQYFRRDNFRLVQKLQRMQLKKKGLFIYHPFNLNTTSQLVNESKPQKSLNQSDTQISGFRSARGSYRKLQPRLSHKTLKHNFLSTSRQRQSTRKKNLRDLLSNISNIATQNHKYRITKKIQTGLSTPQRSSTPFVQLSKRAEKQ